jgi:hypothetical protein
LLFEISQAHEHVAGRRFATLRQSFVDAIYKAFITLAKPHSGNVYERMATNRRVCAACNWNPSPSSLSLSSSSSSLLAFDATCHRGTLIDMIVSYLPLMMGA